MNYRAILWALSVLSAAIVIQASAAVIGYWGYCSLVPIVLFWPLQLSGKRAWGTISRLADFSAVILVALDVLWGVLTVTGH